MFWKGQKAVRRLEEDVRALRNELHELQSAYKRLTLEWEDLYDKVRRQMGRMSKRLAVDAAESAGAEGAIPASSDSDGLDPVSRSIMLRRAHTGFGK